MLPKHVRYQNCATIRYTGMKVEPLTTASLGDSNSDCGFQSTFPSPCSIQLYLS